MTQEFNLSIVDFNRQTFNGPVQSVTVPGSNGELTILPNHIPLVTPLRGGEVVVRYADNKEEFIAVSGGFLVVEPKSTTLLVENAALFDEINEEAVLAAKEDAEKALKETNVTDQLALENITRSLEHSMAQLKMVRKHKQGPHTR